MSPARTIPDDIGWTASAPATIRPAPPHGIPARFCVRQLVAATDGAECLLLYRFGGGGLVGRIERPAVPLPGRHLWTLYDAAGRRIGAAERPEHFNYAGLNPPVSGDRDNG